MESTQSKNNNKSSNASSTSSRVRIQFEKNVYRDSSLVAIIEHIAGSKELLGLFVQDFVERVLGYRGLLATWRSLLVDVVGRLFENNDNQDTPRPASYLLHWFVVRGADRKYIKFFMNCVSPLQVYTHFTSLRFSCSTLPFLTSILSFFLSLEYRCYLPLPMLRSFIIGAEIFPK